MIQELWANPQVRSVVLGILSMLIISVCKKYSTVVNESKVWKYVSVSVLSVLAALFVQLYVGAVVDIQILAVSTITIFASAVTSYETIGKVAQALMQQYEIKRGQ